MGASAKGSSSVGPIRNKTKFIFICLVMMRTIDLVADWLFYKDVQGAAKGLVFGSIDKSTVYACLIFSLFASVTFVVELVLLVKEHIFNNSEYEKATDVVGLVIASSVEFPQVVLLLVVSLCRPEPSSIFQMTKAGLIVIKGMVKIVIISVNVFYKKTKPMDWIKGLTIFFVVVEFGTALFVFFCTQVVMPQNGGFRFPTPTTIVKNRLKENIYFSDVSVFLNDPNRVFSGVGNVDGLRDEQEKWLRLVSIEHIRNYTSISICLEYQHAATTNTTMLRVWEKEGSNSWVSLDCFNIGPTGTAPSQNETECAFSSPSSLYMTFKYEKAETFFKNHLLGDILFNAKHKKFGEGTSELTAKDFTDTVLTEHFNQQHGNLAFGYQMVLHYFKHKPINDTHDDPGLVSGQYLYGEYLRDVKDEWKTGWMQCPTTGNLAPTFTPNLKVGV